MKKTIIVISLVLAIVIAIFAIFMLAGNQSPIDPTDPDNLTEPTKNPIHDVVDVAPTNKYVSAYPFVDWEYWSVEKTIDDVDHLVGPYYAFIPYDGYQEGLDVFAGTWDEIKDVQLNVMKAVDGNRRLDVRRGDSNDPVITFEFGEDVDETLTIGEAYEQGYWRYIKSSPNGLDYSTFFVEEPDGELIDAIIDVWGAPTEVAYKYFGNIVMFFLIYDTEDYTVIIGGNTQQRVSGNHISLQSIAVCGKSVRRCMFGDDYIYEQLDVSPAT